jgi:hypothetical protein
MLVSCSYAKPGNSEVELLNTNWLCNCSKTWVLSNYAFSCLTRDGIWNITLCNCSVYFTLVSLVMEWEFICLLWPVSGPNRVGDQSIPPTQTQDVEYARKITPEKLCDCEGMSPTGLGNTNVEQTINAKGKRENVRWSAAHFSFGMFGMKIFVVEIFAWMIFAIWVVEDFLQKQKTRWEKRFGKRRRVSNMVYLFIYIYVYILGFFYIYIHTWFL